MNLIKSKVVRDGPLENLWKYQKNIRASIHAMAWKKKIHTRNFGNEKKFLRLENSLLPP